MATGKGTKVFMGTGTDIATAIFTQEDRIANIRSVGEHSPEYDEIEITDLDSGEDKEFELTMRDNGVIDLTFRLAEENYKTLKASEGKKLPFAIAHPTATDINIKFMAWVKSVKRGEITPNDEIICTATLRITGGVETFEEPVE